jgi:hypothetical protein
VQKLFCSAHDWTRITLRSLTGGCPCAAAAVHTPTVLRVATTFPASLASIVHSSGLTRYRSLSPDSTLGSWPVP